MLIHTMSLDEMRAAIRKELTWVERYKLRVKTVLMRQKRKNKTKSGSYAEWAKHPTSYTDWVFSGHYFSRTFEVNAYCHYRAPEGSYLLRFYNGDNTLIRFNPHFFDRYKERLVLKQRDYQHVVEYFIRRNIENHGIPQSMSALKLREDGKDYPMIGITVEGVGLGIHHQKKQLYEFKTFVSNALLYHTQTSMREFVLDELMKLHTKYCEELNAQEAFKVSYIARKLLQTEIKLLAEKQKRKIQPVTDSYSKVD